MTSDAERRLIDVERGRDCYARRAWSDAYEALERADALEPLAADDLERLAWSASHTARDSELLRLLERLHQMRLDGGDSLGAGHAAFWLGFRLISMGEMARASGWFARAQRLIEGEASECSLRGYLMLPVAFRHLLAQELDAAYKAAGQAVEIGEGCGDRDLVTFARHVQGLVLVRQGNTEDGLALLDEAMVAVTTGELSPLLTGLIYCGVIACCQRVYALNRAREWTSALTDWCQRQPQLVTFTGSCLVHRSEILQLGGDWPAAIEEARRASECCTRFDRSVAAHASYQQAEIHRLRGEFQEAEEAYRRASELGREPQPGLALLRLAQERQDVAGNAIRRVISTTTDRISARGTPARVRRNHARARGGRRGARGLPGARRDRCESQNRSARCDGRARTGGHSDERREYRGGGRFATLRISGVAADRRSLPGSAHPRAAREGVRALGDEDGAMLELSAAGEVFEGLGALPDVSLRRCAHQEVAATATFGLRPRELEVLRLVASGKTNKVIAQSLLLSEKTVDRHVSNIFVKLNVASRAAATAYAYEHGLIRAFPGRRG